jgi:integrase
VWRRQGGGLHNVSLNIQLSTLRVFIKWAEKVDAVEIDLHEYITPPTMSRGEDVSTTLLGDEKAADVLRFYYKYEYATRDHALLELLWHTGMRFGAIRAIDLEDLDQSNKAIYVRHRPDEGTPLKNGNAGERVVALKDDVYQIVVDYIEHNRKPTTDDHGRSPLFSTAHGRLAKQTMRRAVYAATRPCVYRDSCPHNREIEECEAAGTSRNASKCPSSVSPHAVRKGAITWARLNDIPVGAISGRMDVSPEVLKKHYDQRTSKEEMESRRRYFDNL